MSKRKYEPGSFVPCSPKHKHCSPAHTQLVAGYREERARQEILLENETGNYAGDLKWHKENGKTIITFKTWLKSNKKTEEYMMVRPVKNVAPTVIVISPTHAEGIQNEYKNEEDFDDIGIAFGDGSWPVFGQPRTGRDGRSA